jgi:hypothetical protein
MAGRCEEDSCRCEVCEVVVEWEYGKVREDDAMYEDDFYVFTGTLLEYCGGFCVCKVIDLD